MWVWGLEFGSKCSWWATRAMELRVWDLSVEC